MRRRQHTAVLLALSMFGAWTSGCVGAVGTQPRVLPKVSEGMQSASGLRSTTSGAQTDSATLHPQKDSPLKIERVTDEMLRQAAATHVGQSLQDVPGIQHHH